MKRLIELEKELDSKIPRSVVMERAGGGGRSLSYLTAHYVIDRLNQVFGHTNWDKEILDIKEVTNTTAKGKFPAYITKVRLTIRTENGLLVKEGFGYGADKSDQNAHELAIKESVADAMKVAAKDLGMSLGLALYDKEQVNVEDESKEQEPVTKAEASPKPSPFKVATRTPKASNNSATPQPSKEEAAAPQEGELVDRAKLLEKTGSQAMVLQKVKGKTIDEVKQVLSDMFGKGRSRHELSVDELAKLSATFDTMLA